MLSDKPDPERGEEAASVRFEVWGSVFVGFEVSGQGLRLWGFGRSRLQGLGGFCGLAFSFEARGVAGAVLMCYVGQVNPKP